MAQVTLAARLAMQDFAHDWRIALCQILGLAAVLAPLLVLFGLRFGLIDTMAQRLIEDPRNREVTPAGSGRYDEAVFATLAADPRIAFVVPATRSIAANFTRLRAEGGGPPLSAIPVLPTGFGDPLLGRAAPPADDGAVLTRRLAETLGVTEGARLQAEITRQRLGRIEAERLPLTVAGITDAPVGPAEAVLAPLGLLVATEDWRDGFAVPDRGWAGNAPAAGQRVFARFRLYARSIYDVEGLERDLKQRGIQVRTAAAEIGQMRALDRNLGIAFWLITGCGALGYLASLAAGLRGHVERKRRDLAMLRLLGLPTRSLVSFPVTQSVLIALFGSLLAIGTFQMASVSLNAVFAEGLQPGEKICRLLPGHIAFAVAATIATAVLSAGWAGALAAGIQPSEGLRDV